MDAYKCVKCGIMTPITDGSGKELDKDRPCFKCGCKERIKITLPNFVQSKKGKRRRFSKKGSIIKRIGI
jgi:hypothetical protein